ncbi:MAG: aspartate/glutamate racemase family protein [Candidatus Competibacterales bacterium]
MTQRVLIGMLTPSSNTVLEPVTSAMVAELPEVSMHFGRFRVVKIALDAPALGQFDAKSLLAAAELLADAKVKVIAWNGTSAGWLGFDSDEALCRAITAATGIPATTSVLALNEVLNRTGVQRLGLVTPYTDDIQDKILQHYAAAGYQCVAERHLGDPGNFSFSEIPSTTIARLVREVATHQPQAITTFCTNLPAAPLVETLEEETGIPIYDTIGVVVWKSLVMAGVDPGRVKGWGRLFRERG